MHCNDKSDFTETCIEAYRLIYKIIFPTHRKTLLHDATFGHKNTSAWHDKNSIEKGKSFLLRLNKLLQLSSLVGDSPLYLAFTRPSYDMSRCCGAGTPENNEVARPPVVWGGFKSLILP